MSKILSMLLCLFALSACATNWDLNTLKRTEPKGDAFHRALATYYKDYAEDQAAGYDWEHSQYFARKGLLVAYGNNAAPEDPTHWGGINKTVLPQLIDGRAQLMQALTPQTIAANGETAALTQARYDCWVENQNEGWQTARIDACREAFYENLEKLNHGEKSAMPVEKMDYTVFFEFNSFRLNKDGEKIVRALAQSLKRRSDTQFVLNGHTDRAGSDQYNFQLGLKRANTVKQSLMDLGVPQGRISVYSFGENDPAVKTADGVKEPRNRRVEINFSD